MKIRKKMNWNEIKESKRYTERNVEIVKCRRLQRQEDQGKREKEEEGN